MERVSRVTPFWGNRYQNLISPGVVRDLQEVPFHGNGMAPLKRRVLIGDGVQPQADTRVIAHELYEVTSGVRNYCEPHRHDVDEINILLSQGHLLYDIRLGDERYEVEAPSSIYIPAGLVHSANVIEGSGFFVAVIASAKYEALPPPPR